MALAQRTESVWKLRADLASAKLLIWVATVGRDADLSPATHLYLANRYDRLSHVHRVRGHHSKALRLARLAADHYHEGGWSGPPYEAAMALPRPTKRLVIDAVSHDRAGGSSNVA